MLRAGSCRSARPIRRQARARDRSGRRPWTADDRAPRCRQNPARTTIARLVAAARPLRGPGSRVPRIGRGTQTRARRASPAVSQPAAHRLGRRADRRRPSRPGELSLAHLGVLFLDELPEFARNALEALREPLESGVVVVSRAKRSCEFPARFQLVAAMNPCPCGYAGDPSGRCRLHRGASRPLSPPNLRAADRPHRHARRIDGVPVEHLVGRRRRAPENSAAVARRVPRARTRSNAAAGQTQCAADPSRSSSASAGSIASRARSSARLSHDWDYPPGPIIACSSSRAPAPIWPREPEIRRVDVAEAVQLRALDRVMCERAVTC